MDPQPHAPRGPLIKRDPMTAPDPMTVPRHMWPQCKATTRQGKRCKQPSIQGGTVCRFHGGAAPQVKQAAMERLRALQHPAIDRLAQLIDQEEFPSVSFAASRDVLDRTMGKASETLEVTVGATDALLARLDAWKAKREA